MASFTIKPLSSKTHSVLKKKITTGLLWQIHSTENAYTLYLCSWSVGWNPALLLTIECGIVLFSVEFFMHAASFL